MKDIMNEETQRLLWTLTSFREILEQTKQRFDAMPALYRDDPDLLNDLLLQTHNRIAHLERAKSKPYFARIDFTETGGAAEKCYIGKIGVSDEENRIITVDWRAPVSTLYYDSNVGEVRYDAPGGVVTGTLDLKRQIEIEAGELISVNDVDTVANDDLLKPYLGVNADNRLKNIVASIQSEQNQIIREKLERNVIVQGAAGSGKTTVALHRIAYLAYSYRETIRPKQYMVIGPNAFFISYISSVLPDLDVDSVPQYTFAQLAGEYIGDAYQLTDSYETLRCVLAGRHHGTVEQFKTSMRYQEALDRFLSDFERSVLPETDFTVKGCVLLTKSEVKKTFDSARVTEAGTIQARVNRCILMLSGIIRNRHDLLEMKISEYFREKYRTAQDSKGLDQLHRDRESIEKELERGCLQPLKKYFSRVNLKPLALYRLFLQEAETHIESGYGETQELKTQALALLRRRTLTPEDLPGVMYLRIRVKGAPEYENFRHAIVDEAQDYGAFELYVLRKLLSGATFTVVGDLAQAIFGYRSIDSWDTVLRDSFAGGAILCEMHKSYRTTVEIMQMANRVAAGLGLAEAQPVIRHGDPVGFHAIQTAGRSKDAMAQAVCAMVRAYEPLHFQSVAIISKTQEEALEMAAALREMELPARSITDDGEPYTGGLCSISAFQAKGLEFDGVILPDASETVYSARRIDQHLLYVAMTRPLHRLDIFYTGSLCAPLRNLE